MPTESEQPPSPRQPQPRSADRRTQRTKKLLRQALIDLAQRGQGLSSITVSDLTAQAEINRGTFYLHYRDVYDLIEQLQAEILQGLEAIASQMSIPGILQYAQRREPYPGLVSVFEYWNRHADFCGLLFGPKGDPSFAGRVKQLMKERMYGSILKAMPELAPAESRSVPIDFIFAFMTSANIGLIQHWFETGRRQTPMEMARMMTIMIGQGPVQAYID